MKHDHIMIDLETMGNKSFSSILSIGAVNFNIVSGDIGETFYRNITLQSNFDAGLKVDADTIEWWFDQNKEAKKMLFSDHRVDLESALYQLYLFCTDEDKEYYMWGNSPRFDLGLLTNAYHSLKLNIPWNFQKERDVRTLVSLAPQIKDNYKYIGAAHNPVIDCINQIGYCSLTWNHLFH